MEAVLVDPMKQLEDLETEKDRLHGELRAERVRLGEEIEKAQARIAAIDDVIGKPKKARKKRTPKDPNAPKRERKALGKKPSDKAEAQA